MLVLSSFGTHTGISTDVYICYERHSPRALLWKVTLIAAHCNTSMYRLNHQCWRKSDFSALYVTLQAINQFFTQYFTNWHNGNLLDTIWKNYHAPLVAPRESYGWQKIPEKKYAIVKEESCHNFLSTRSCFGSSVSDWRYLMVYMTLRLLYMPAQIIKMMAFTQIMAIWTSMITL